MRNVHRLIVLLLAFITSACAPSAARSSLDTETVTIPYATYQALVSPETREAVEDGCMNVDRDGPRSCFLGARRAHYDVREREGSDALEIISLSADPYTHEPLLHIAGACWHYLCRIDNACLADNGGSIEQCTKFNDCCLAALVQ